MSAAARIRKSCLCLCTNGVSVDQWKYQFEMWTNIQVFSWYHCGTAVGISSACGAAAPPRAPRVPAAPPPRPPPWRPLAAHLARRPLPCPPLVMPQKGQVCRFTSQTREWFESPAGVCITTYTMVGWGLKPLDGSEWVHGCL